MSRHESTENGAQHENDGTGHAEDCEPGTLPGDADCELDRFVRNRYFHGKLMTARDMQLEQEYHADRLETLAQHATGEGAVCGLSTSLNQEEAGTPLEVTVRPGFALDCCGQPVLLDTTAHETFSPDRLPAPAETGAVAAADVDVGVGRDAEDELEEALERDGDRDWPPGVSVYVRLKECQTEKVPIPGSEDACRENCTYNRVVEDYQIELETGEPEPPKAVRDVEFPDREELSSYDDQSGADPRDPALQKMARTYYGEAENGDFHHLDCDEDGDPRVYLGFYARTGDGWELLEAAAPRHYVYSNDMLYAAIARHATDFSNPHENVESVEGLTGRVGVSSPDRTLDVAAAAGPNDVELTAGSWLEPLAPYMADRALKTVVTSFSFIGLWFLQRRTEENVENTTEIFRNALRVVSRARTAIENHAYEDETEFLDATRDITERAQNLRTSGTLQTLATQESFDRFTSELDELRNVTTAFDEPVSDEDVASHDGTQVAYDLDQMAQATQFLTHLATEFPVRENEAGQEEGLKLYIWLPLMLDMDISYLSQQFGTTRATTASSHALSAESAGMARVTGGLTADIASVLESDATPVIESLEANNEDYVVEATSTAELDREVQPGTVVSHAVEAVDDGERYRISVAGTPLEDVGQVGGDRSKQLIEAGLTSAEQLAEADVETVASALGMDADASAPKTIIENARSLVGGQ